MGNAISLQLELGSDDGTQPGQEILGWKERKIFSGMDQKSETTQKDIERLDWKIGMLLIKVWRKFQKEEVWSAKEEIRRVFCRSTRRKGKMSEFRGEFFVVSQF